MKDIKLICFLFLFTIGIASAKPLLLVDPTGSFGGIGSTFSKNVVLANFDDLYAYQFRLNWNPQSLECTNVNINKIFGVNCLSIYNPDCSNPDPLGGVNNAQGYYDIAYTAKDPTLTGLNSNPGVLTLVTLTFRVKNTGWSSINISKDMLVDSKGGLIDHTVANGYWQTNVPTTIRRPLRGSGGTRWSIPLDLVNTFRDFFARIFKI
jgi:hypothetical protein